MNLRTSILAIAFALAGAALSACSAGGLSEQSARSVVVASEAAWKRSNVDQVAAYVAADCVLHDTSPKPDGTTATTTKACKESLDQQRSLIASAASNGADHRYESTPPTITIEGDKAIARMHATESLSKNGKGLLAESDQVETLQLRDGKLLITQIDVKATGLTVEGKRIF
jgi:hypothetical protein